MYAPSEVGTWRLMGARGSEVVFVRVEKVLILTSAIGKFIKARSGQVNDGVYPIRWILLATWICRGCD